MKKAIDQRCPGYKIQSYQSKSVGEGVSAISRSTILLEDEAGTIFEGLGEDQDIEIAAMRALINAVNNAYVDKNYLLGNSVIGT